MALDTTTAALELLKFDSWPKMNGLTATVILHDV